MHSRRSPSRVPIFQTQHENAAAHRIISPLKPKHRIKQMHNSFSPAALDRVSQNFFTAKVQKNKRLTSCGDPYSSILTPNVPACFHPPKQILPCVPTCRNFLSRTFLYCRGGRKVDCLSDTKSLLEIDTNYDNSFEQVEDEREDFL